MKQRRNRPSRQADRAARRLGGALGEAPARHRRRTRFRSLPAARVRSVRMTGVIPSASVPARVGFVKTPARLVVVSVVTAWEVVVKARLGKLTVVGEPGDFIRTRLRRQRLPTLDVTLDHVLTVAALPDHHKDPFDRLLVAQAFAEGLALLSSDASLGRYPGVKIYPAGGRRRRRGACARSRRSCRSASLPDSRGRAVP